MKRASLFILDFVFKILNAFGSLFMLNIRLPVINKHNRKSEFKT